MRPAHEPRGPPASAPHDIFFDRAWKARRYSEHGRACQEDFEANPVFRGDWEVLHKPLVEHWLPFVRGETSREEAARNLLAAFGERPGERLVGALAGRREDLPDHPAVATTSTAIGRLRQATPNRSWRRRPMASAWRSRRGASSAIQRRLAAHPRHCAPRRRARRSSRLHEGDLLAWRVVPSPTSTRRRRG